MKLWLIRLVIAAGLTASFVGCGAQGVGEVEDPAADADTIENAIPASDEAGAPSKAESADIAVPR